MVKHFFGLVKFRSGGIFYFFWGGGVQSPGSSPGSSPAFRICLT